MAQKSGWDKSWTQPPYPVPDDLVQDVGNFLMSNIDKSPDQTFICGVKDVAAAVGKHPDNDYALVLAAIAKARREFNIASEKNGCKGNIYTFGVDEGEDKAIENDNKVLDQIKFIINAVDEKKAKAEDLATAFRIIKQILA